MSFKISTIQTILLPQHSIRPLPEIYVGGGVGCFSSVPSVRSPSRPSLILCLFFASKWPLKSFGGALLAPFSGENDICNHKTRSVGVKYIKMCLQPSAGNVSMAANIELFLLNEIYKIN